MRETGGLDRVEREVLAFFRREARLPAGQRLVVGVSGGPDSTCLLHCLWRLRSRLGLEVVVAHFNHCLRGEEADRDQEYAASLAASFGFPFLHEKADVAAYRAAEHLSLEEAARRLRHKFLCRVSQRVGAGHYALGHTADDAAETILLHLLRGSGLRGLAGISPIASSPVLSSERPRPLVLRPLLRVWRREVEEHCQRWALAPRTDSSNLLPQLTRNRLRQLLLPALEAYNPRVRAALLRLGQAAAAAQAHIEAEVRAAWPAVASTGEGCVELSLEGLVALSPALQAEALQQGFAGLAGGAESLEMAHLEALVALPAKPPGSRLDLPLGVTATRGYQTLRLWLAGDATALHPRLEGEHRLSVPGLTRLPGWRICAEIMPAQEVGDLTSGTPWQAHLDLAQAGTELLVRARRPGDTFKPLGLGGTKKLQDFLVDRKIPREQRDNIPLVTDAGGGILWVVGQQVDERVKVTEATERVLRLRFSRKEEG